MEIRISELGLAIRHMLVMTASAVLAAPAFAQQASEPTDLGRVSVTGSRIRGASIETRQPILTLTRESLAKQGFTSVADVLSNLTSAGSPTTSRADALASGEGVGGYYIDIRNLGSQRTLVLMNGKRLGATTGGRQDLSQIPLAAVERIEVLKDGASSIYGSDAIAGVVNIITRRNVDGAEANVYMGQYGEGDGGIQQFSMTLGARGERGNVTLAAEYSKENPVWAKDRWFSRDGGLGPNSTSAEWSPLSQNSTWCDPRFWGDCKPRQAGQRQPEWKTLNPGGNPSNPADYHLLTPDEYANANQQMMARTGIKRKSVYATGSYELTDSIIFSADVLYNQRTTDQQIAGYPYQSQAFGTPLSGESVFNPIGQDLEFRRRLWEVPRTTTSDLKTLRFSPSVSGVFEFQGKTWDWDIGALWNRNELTKTGFGDMSLIGSRQALGSSFINGQGVAQCGTAAKPIPLSQCRPWNPLLPHGVNGQGALSDPDLQNFLFPTYTDTGVTKTTSYSANLSGSLFELPAGSLSVAMGYEHRKEEGHFVPDAFRQSGQSTGLAATTTSGDYSLDEFYLELNVPILADLPFAKELTLSVSSRYSDYSNFGATLNSKFGLAWRPVEELLVRGTYAEGFRAPTVDDLYGGINSSFERYVDPCGSTSPGNVAGSAACTTAGVPANYVQVGQGYVPCSTFPCATPDQFMSGSNSALKPETSKGKTVGLVWSPRWVEGLDISLDWYRYELKNMIIADSVDRILRDCYVLGNSARCAGIVRAADGHIGALNYGLSNLGSMETEGYDLGVKYRLPELSIGKFGIDWQTSYLAKYNEAGQNNRGGNITIGRVGEPGLFRVRSNLGLNWELGDFGANWTARYYSGMKENCIDDAWCDAPDHYANGNSDPLRHTGSNTFHDVQVSWKAPWDATIALGANNVFAHRAALMYSAPDSGFAYYGGFDIGRFLYMKYQQRF